MANLSTKYLGLTLKNPVIASSSGITSNLKNIIELANHGAGAIVLKSLFEEQILMKASHDSLERNFSEHPEGMEYLNEYSKHHSLDDYLKLIQDAKRETNLPIIASINCVSDKEWINFTKSIQDAGADALELNLALFPGDVKKTSKDYEKIYFDILEKVNKATNLPIAVKISSYSAGLAHFIQQLDWSGYVKGIVLFNRFYSPDFDVETLKVSPSSILSNPSEITLPLRWVSIMSGKVKSDLSATTGIHDGEGVVKQLLAGASTVQVASCLYENSLIHMASLIEELEEWMDNVEYKTIDEFRGKMSQEKLDQPAVMERIQYMKYLS